MASNDSELADEDGEFSDWIEIYNPDASPVNMAGWSLSDEETDLDKWIFPAVSIPSGGYLVVFASDKDRDTAGSELHTNFKLSSAGEYLALVKPNGLTKTSEFNPFPSQNTDVSYGINTSLTLLSSDAPLTYVLESPGNDAQGDVWTEHDFDDSAWESGTAGIGYENGSGYGDFLNTNVPSGTTQTWVRFSFLVDDVAGLSNLLLRLRYDDGFEAYLNGTVLTSSNASAPVQAGESSDWVDFDISSQLSALRVGGNVLAVKMVNASASSSDFLLVPELTVTQIGSMATFGYYINPSPGVANQGGVVNPGPIISEVTENPPALADEDDLVISAHVLPRDIAIDAVTLRYRVNYAGELSIAMNDAGVAGDVTAGDGIFSATIPASASNPGEMLRWTVVASDTEANQSRLPAQTDSTGNSQSPGYFGAVIEDGTLLQNIPVMHWFTQSVSDSRNRTGARASVFYEGKFYDNIYVRQRGGYTNTSSQKFDFNKGAPFYVNEDMPSVGEVNMNAQGYDSSYLRQPLGFQFHQASGNPASFAFMVNMRLNGSFDRVGTLIEQIDEDFLKRYGYDDEGEVFKFVQRNNLNPAFDDATTGVEKKTGDLNDFSSFQALVDDLKQSSQDARITSFYDNLDVPEFINYMAIRAVQQQADDVRKNFYMYKDAAGDGRWRIFPWDLDFTWDIVGGHGETRVDHPFFGIEAQPTDDGNDQWNRLYDVAFEDVTMQRLMLRRLRTLMDNHLKSSPTGGWFESSIDSIFNSMTGLSGPNSANKDALRNTDVPERRDELFNIYTSSIPGMSTVIPAPQPSNPAVMIDEIDFSPSGGDQDQEYIRIVNTEDTEIDISGWSLSSGVTFAFPAGTVIPRNGEIYVSPELSKFVTRDLSPTASEKRLVTGPYQGHLSSFGEDIVLMNDSGAVVQTFSYVGNPSLAQQHLKIIQIHYAPVANPDAEFIELMNTSPTETIDLTGVTFINGIEFDFTGSNVTSVWPMQRILVVKSIAAFESVYGTMLTSSIAGEFANGTSLDNGGEAIKLDDSTGSTIASFSYDDDVPWSYKQGHAILFDLGFGSTEPPLTEPDPSNPEDWYVSPGVEGEPGGASPLFRPWLASRGQTDPLLQTGGWSELLTYALGRDLAGENFVYKLAIETAAGESGFGFSVGGAGEEEDYYLTMETTIREWKDVDVVVQTSTNMVNWSDANDAVEIWNSSNGDGTLSVKYQIGDPLAVGQKLFARLIVPE